MSRRASVVAVLLCAAATACTSLDQQVEFHQPITLAGTEVSAHVLNEGREAYMEYCFSCHGIDGDGNGPAARGMRPPPRDFRTGIFKFARVVDGP
jgi:mono/diheme cytochrome c family protein